MNRKILPTRILQPRSFAETALFASDTFSSQRYFGSNPVPNQFDNRQTENQIGHSHSAW